MVRGDGFVALLVTIFFMVTACAGADVITLKRGGSFEGKIVNETNDTYVVQMDVGIVQFKKDTVDGVQWYSDVENARMEHDWAHEESEPFYEVGRSLEQEVVEQPRGKKDDARVPYQGRLVTPEVYGVIEREKEIQERRYRYLKEQRNAGVKAARRREAQRYSEVDATREKAGSESVATTAAQKKDSYSALSDALNSGKQFRSFGANDSVKSVVERPDEGSRDESNKVTLFKPTM